MLYKKNRAFEWVNVHFSRTKGYKTVMCQSLRFEKKIWLDCIQATPFFRTSNFDVWQFGRPLSWKDVDDFIWKIYIFSKAYYLWKMCCRLLRWFLLAQNTPILHRKMALKLFWVPVTVYLINFKTTLKSFITASVSVLSSCLLQHTLEYLQSGYFLLTQTQHKKIFWRQGKHSVLRWF